MKIKVLFLVVFVFALIVRGYNFHSWFVFEYDQEKNAQIAKAIIVEHKLTLIGPETSVGGMYVGPYYNYTIALFYWLGNMNPYSMVFLNLIISGMTLCLLYYAGQKLFSPKTGLFAAILYGFSALIVNLDRVAWNPSPIPLVTIGMSLFLLIFRQEKKTWQLMVSAIFAAFSLQLHINSLFLLTYFFVFCFLFIPLKQFLRPKKIILLFIIFFISIIPLILFDFRHDFLNSRHFIQFLFGGHNASVGNLFHSLVNTSQVCLGLLSGIISPNKNWVRTLIVLAIFIWWLIHVRISTYTFCFIFLVLEIIGFSFYHGALPPYYFVSLFPIFILITASALGKLFETKAGKMMVAVLLTIFLINNLPLTLSESPFSFEHKLQAVSYILDDAKGRPFTVNYVTSPGLKTGFDYLFWYKSRFLPPSLKSSLITYKIVLFDKLYEKAQNTHSFGRVDVVKRE